MSDHPIVAFIEARLAEDEAVAKGLAGATRMIGGQPNFYGCGGPAAGTYWRHFPDHRMLREVEAKRAILLDHADVNDGDCGTCVVAEWGYPTHGGSTIARHPCKTVRLLAAPFASHPDYLAEWSVC